MCRGAAGRIRLDGRRRAREARRRQAEFVTAWLVRSESQGAAEGQGYAGPIVQNASQQLVYQVIANLVSVQGAFRETAVGDTREDADKYRAYVGQVPPGQLKTRIPGVDYGMFIRFGVELAFQDAAGRYWLRRGDGRLREVRKSPLELYGISPPVDWPIV